MSWGPAAGYSFGIPLSIARDAGVVNRSATTLSGTSADHRGWAGVQLFDPSWLGSRWGWSATAALAMSSGSFTSEPFAAVSAPVVQAANELSQVDVFALIGTLQFNAQMQYNINRHWFVGAGPWFSYRWASRIVRQEYTVLREDGNGLFIPLGEGEADTVLAERSLTSSPLRGGLAFSLSYRFPLQHTIDLMPSIQTEFDASSFFGDKLGIRATRIGIGISMLFNGKQNIQPVEYLRDTVYITQPIASVPVPSTAPTLQAAIQLYSTKDKTQKMASVPIERNSTYFKQSSELLPIVFFEHNSAAVPARYMQLQPQQPSEGFSRHALARLSPVQMYYHVLNIIGTRMRENPTTVVALTGSTVEGEPIALALARTESVHNYLRDVWGIDSKRIEMRKERGVGRSRAVVMSSISESLTQPVVVEWKLQSLAAPPVKLRHNIVAHAGLQSWNLLLTYQGKQVGQYGGTTVQELDSVNLAFHISAAALDSALVPLTATLVVNDRTGGSTTATAAIPLVWNTTEDILPTDTLPMDTPIASNEKENVSAVLFASDVEARSVVNNPLLQSLLSSVRADARITISSLMNHNRDDGEGVLLRPDRLAEAVLAALKKRNMHIAEMHVQRQVEDALPSLQGLPEKTLFQSAVYVVVEQAGKQ